MMKNQNYQVRRLACIEYNKESFDLKSYTFGSDNPHVPSMLIVGGIHGLEKIGSDVAYSIIETLNHRLEWETPLQFAFEKIKLIIIPEANPVGIRFHTRCNENGVDLMRNCPVDSNFVKSYQLFGGHRISPRLPWYRGKENTTEIATSTLLDLVKNELSPKSFSIILDMHSGVGFRDRIWFPYAHSPKKFEYIDIIYKMRETWQKSSPFPIYKWEPQSRHYYAHGDLWDYCFSMHHQCYPKNVLIPLTLEMGSWNGIKKSPINLLTVYGTFNPIKPHRKKRAIRRHSVLVNYLINIAASKDNWLKSDLFIDSQKFSLRVAKWYEEERH